MRILSGNYNWEFYINCTSKIFCVLNYRPPTNFFSKTNLFIYLAIFVFAIIFRNVPMFLNFQKMFCEHIYRRNVLSEQNVASYPAVDRSKWLQSNAKTRGRCKIWCDDLILWLNQVINQSVKNLPFLKFHKRKSKRIETFEIPKRIKNSQMHGITRWSTCGTQKYGIRLDPFFFFIF